MLSSCIHFKELQPIYAYKGYTYKNECNIIYFYGGRQNEDIGE